MRKLKQNDFEIFRFKTTEISFELKLNDYNV